MINEKYFPFLVIFLCWSSIAFAKTTVQDNVTTLIQLDSFPPLQDKQKWVEIGLGTSIGSYKTEKYIWRNDDENKLKSFAVDVNCNLVTKRWRLSAGLKTIFGLIEEVGQDQELEEQFYNGIGIYGQAGGKYFGFLLGTFFDQVKFLGPTNGEESFQTTIGHFRLGRIDGLSLKFKAGTGHAFSYYPQPEYSVGVAYGLKDLSGATELYVGIFNSHKHRSIAISIKHPLKNSWIIDAGVYFDGYALFSVGVRNRIYAD